jgi:hypothetical protein
MNLGSHPAWQPVSCLFVPKIAVSAMVLADGRFGYGLSSVYRVTPAVCSAVEEWSKIAGCLSVLRWLSVCVCACVCVCVWDFRPCRRGLVLRFASTISRAGAAVSLVVGCLAEQEHAYRVEHPRSERLGEDVSQLAGGHDVEHGDGLVGDLLAEEVDLGGDMLHPFGRAVAIG